MDKELSDLIERIYAAALDPDEWHRLLQCLGDRFRSGIAGLYSLRLPSGETDGFPWIIGVDEAETKAYLTHYYKDSPNIHALATHALGSVYVDGMLPDYAVYENSEAYNDFWKPMGAQYLLNLVPHRETGRHVSLSFRRGSREGPYGDDDIARLQALAPHILQSVRIARDLSRRDGLSRALAESLERSERALLILDRNGEILFMNAGAEAVFALDDGLSLDARGTPRARLAGESGRLSAAIRTAADGGMNGGSAPDDVLVVTRPSQRAPYQIAVAPLAYGDQFYGHRRTVIVAIADPDQIPQTSERSLRAHYGLTEREARFVAEFVETASLEAVAERLSLTRNSARTYLKRVFAKTGVSSQAALMKLVLTGATLPRTRW